MKSISLAAGAKLDLETLLDTRLLVQANSGGGKSYLLRLLMERAGQNVQTIVLDNEGEFYTLREKLDMVLVGTDGEIPASPRSAGLLARRLLEAKVSAVVDLYELKLNERRSFVKVFLEALIHLPRDLWRPTLIVIDEAHLYAPERGSGEAESTDAVISLMSQGRKRGYCGVLATQRFSKLHKDAAAECNNVVIGRTTLDNDQKRAGDMLGMSKQDATKLRDLDAGHWFAFGPAFSNRHVFTFAADKVETTHPKAGQRHAITPPAPSAKIKSVLAKLADLPQQAEAEIRDATAMRKRIAELEREVKAKPKPTVDESVIEKRVAEAVERERKRIAVYVNDRLRRVSHEIDAAKESAAHAIFDDAKPSPMVRETQVERVLAANHQHAGVKLERPPFEGRTQLSKGTVIRHDATYRRAESNGHLPPGERAVLTAAAQFGYENPPTREQVGILVGYKRSSRDAYIARLAAKGYVETNGNLVRATESGVEALGPDFEPLPTGDALREYWLERLPEGERKILEVLIEAYPHERDRESLGEDIGYKRSSRDAYLARLATKRLVVASRGAVRASDTLFE